MYRARRPWQAATALSRYCMAGRSLKTGGVQRPVPYATIPTRFSSTRASARSGIWIRTSTSSSSSSSGSAAAGDGRGKASKATRNNLILMGPPGAGKTSVGACLAERLSLSHVDIDNDHLENIWGCPVADKLNLVKGEQFVHEEGMATLQLAPDITNTVISLSGSNPMHRQAMDHLSSIGTVVYLDVDQQDILQRLQAMKVNRIVGQTEGDPMDEILAFRQQFYERAYDVRVIIPSGSDVQTCADVVIATLENHRNLLAGYVSTRCSRGDESAGLEDVVCSGLASDGGLFVPRYPIPKLTDGQWRRLAGLSFPEQALRVLENWLPSSAISPTTLRGMLAKAYGTFQGSKHSVTPVVPLKSCRTPHGQQVFTQELFWGPTASFKDLSLQLMPQLLQYFAGKNKYAMVVATSGDTGSAALHGFGSHTSFPVVVFYPGNGGVSSYQEQQMIGLAAQHPHCRAIAVNGDFDFCQSAVKQMFSDVAWRDDLLESFGVQLNAANSINWMRLLPQIIHHAAGYLQLVNDGRIEFGEPLDLCIPSGNFGNAMAALYVKRMGIPFHRILIASNVNNILEEFISTGMYDLTQRSLAKTMSPAIDILVSSNVERLLHLIAHESQNPSHIEWARRAFFELNRTRQFSAPADLLAAISSELAPVSIWDEQCGEQIRDLASSEQYILDPHTAVAVAGCRDGKIPASVARVVLVAGTAHFAKFPDDVSAAVAIPEHLLSDLSGVVPHTSLQGSLAASRQADVVECSASVDDMKRIVKSALLQQAA